MENNFFHLRSSYKVKNSFQWVSIKRAVIGKEKLISVGINNESSYR